MTTEQILDVVWDYISPGDRVRWTTPTFVRRGTILHRVGESLEVQFDGLPHPTQIPYAFWYFLEGRNGNLTEQLVIVDGAPPPKTRLSTPSIQASDAISPKEAANILGLDMKTFRRKLRTGALPGVNEGGRWVCSRDAILKYKR